MPTASFPITPPYNFELSLKFSRRSRFEIVDNTARGHLCRILKINSNSVFFDIWGDGTIENPQGRVSWVALDRKSINRSEAIAVARWILFANLDLNPFYQRGKKSKPVGALIDKFRGLKPILTPTLFEAAAWAIMGQQVNLDFASVLKKRLVEKFGKSFSHKWDNYFQFPQPEDLLGANVGMLQKMQFSTRKAEYIIGLAQVLKDGQLQKSRLAEMNYADAIEALQSIRGIGLWSSNYILMRGVGHLNCLPLGDSGLNRAIRQLYRLDSKPDNRTVEKLAEPFTPYRSLFTLYLWFSLIEGKENS